MLAVDLSRRGFFVFLDDAFQTGDVLHEPVAAQAQEVVSELRILEIDLEQLVVRDGQHVTAFNAFHRLRAAIVF